MNALTARLRLATGHHPDQFDLGHLVGQEVDLWECGTAPTPVGMFTVTRATAHGDVLELVLAPGRLVCGQDGPAWVDAPGMVVLDVSATYRWHAPTLLRLETLAHTTPTRTAKEAAA